MYQRERLEAIMDILKRYNYVTVKYLTEELHYSNATVNRDLNILLKQKRIKRTYGGVEVVQTKSVPLEFRYHKMKTAKNKIGKKAASIICDGDIIFIDGSTTTQYMEKYITEKKNITVITNNIGLVCHLSEYGVDVICLGGRVSEKPNMLGSTETVENVMKYKADKMFFSSIGINENGEILSVDKYYLMYLMMAKNSKEVIYLADHEKIQSDYPKVLFDLNRVDCIISDYDFKVEVKEKYKNTEFIYVK